MKPQTASKLALLFLLLFVTGLFLAMIREMLMAIVLAGIFAALVHPLYRRLCRGFGGRRVPAAFSTLAILVFGGLLPLGGLLGLVAAEALRVGRSVQPWVKTQLGSEAALSQTLQSLPYYEYIAPYRDEILSKAGELVGKVSGTVIQSLSSLTMGTVNLLFVGFIMLYTMFFFLLDGEKLVQTLIYYLPMQEKDERRLLEKFTSVTRATLKGTAVIGIVQGTLAGIAFAVAGIDGALFWGTIMTVLSIIPGVGTAIIWVPAAILLAVGGAYAKAAALAAFCALVVGSVDNLLRPRLVGQDTQMHELFILFGTLGGLFMFGVPGVIIGPIIAALLVTLWDMYGRVFRDSLPDAPPEEDQAPEEDPAPPARPVIEPAPTPRAGTAQARSKRGQKNTPSKTSPKSKKTNPKRTKK